MDDIEYFKVNEDGGQEQIKQFDKDPSEVYIIVDHRSRMIYLWKGINARVRLKFVGSRAMGDRRKDVGYHYKIDVMDEGDESKAFRATMGEEVDIDPNAKLANEGVPSYSEIAAAQGIDVTEKEISEKVGTTSVSGIKMGGVGVKPQKSIIAAMNEDGEISADVAPKINRKMVADQIHTLNMDEAKKILSELGKPSGYEREMVVVGSKVYRSKGDSEVIFEELDNPLDGLFMVDSFTPRLICENGRVIAIELLKRTSEEIDADEIAMSQDLEDLTAMFQIELE